MFNHYANNWFMPSLLRWCIKTRARKVENGCAACMLRCQLRISSRSFLSFKSNLQTAHRHHRVRHIICDKLSYLVCVCVCVWKRERIAICSCLTIRDGCNLMLCGERMVSDLLLDKVDSWDCEEPAVYMTRRLECLLQRFFASSLLPESKAVVNRVILFL